MSLDAARKIAVEALAQIENRTPAVFVLTSSRAGADCRAAAKTLADAFAAAAGSAAVGKTPIGGADAPLTAAAAEQAVAALRKAQAVTVLPLPCLREDGDAMLLTAAAKHVLLLEQRGLSRTDEIDEALELIRNLGARAVGFVLE